MATIAVVRNLLVFLFSVFSRWHFSFLTCSHFCCFSESLQLNLAIWMKLTIFAQRHRHDFEQLNSENQSFCFCFLHISYLLLAGFHLLSGFKLSPYFLELF